MDPHDPSSTTVAALMQRQVTVVEMDQTIGQVEALLTERRLSWAPVLEPNGDIVAVISADDLVRMRAQGHAAADVCAWQLCTYRPICVDGGAGLAEVARQMVARGIHHVVVTEDGRVAGVVSSLDFVRAVADGLLVSPA
jgi:signal-transduction protein with cAMP-binding, CBS, and nucleotidyltransferase domain